MQTCRASSPALASRLNAYSAQGSYVGGRQIASAHAVVCELWFGNISRWLQKEFWNEWCGSPRFEPGTRKWVSPPNGCELAERPVEAEIDRECLYVPVEKVTKRIVWYPRQDSNLRHAV